MLESTAGMARSRTSGFTLSIPSCEYLVGASTADSDLKTNMASGTGLPGSSLVLTGTAWPYSGKRTGTLPVVAGSIGSVTVTPDRSGKVPGSSTIKTGVTTLADSSAGWGGSLSLAALLAIMLIGTVRCTVLRQTAK